MTNYRSEIELGKKYRDTQTGFEGHATVVSFFTHGCERVTLKGMNGQREIVEFSFDSPEVESAETKEPVKLLERKTGGPHDRTPVRRR